MRKLMLAAGVAALAITAPAAADRGGKGHAADRGGKAHDAGTKGNHARGGAKNIRTHKVRSSHRTGGARDRAHNANGRSTMAAAHVQGPKRKSAELNRGASPRGPRHADKAARPHRVQQARNGHAEARRPAPVKHAEKIREHRFADDRPVRRAVLAGEPLFRHSNHRFCPPGLERKGNGCLPPGQAKKLLGSRLARAYADNRVPYAYRNWYPDNDRYLYRMGDGFIYRVSRADNLVNGLIPMFGDGYYSVGDPWPATYDFYNVPYQYRSYWPDSTDYYYRYGDGAIYRVNAGTGVVDAIVALLAGDLGVGSRLPVGYDVYNVPLAYRAQYYDTPDAWYRYNDGYIYRVDPTTRLITAVIEAIV